MPENGQELGMYPNGYPSHPQHPGQGGAGRSSAAARRDAHNAPSMTPGLQGLVAENLLCAWFHSWRGHRARTSQPALLDQSLALAGVGLKLHALVAFGLFALWPFTRLVHVFSAPLGYLTRPYIVYRSRDDRPLGNAAPRRGWDQVGR